MTPDCTQLNLAIFKTSCSVTTSDCTRLKKGIAEKNNSMDGRGGVFLFLVAEERIHHTIQQCKDKLKKLKSYYRAIKDHNELQWV